MSIARLITLIDSDENPVGVIAWDQAKLPDNGREFQDADQPIFDAMDQEVKDALQATLSASRAVELNAERERRIVEGTVFSVTNYAYPVTVPGHNKEQGVISNLAQRARDRLAVGDTSLIYYRDKEDILHGLTPEQTLELWGLGIAWVEYIHFVSWTMKDQPGGIPADFEADHYWV